ncbi:MAG: isopeptide-forming domain-containing fimbrial protein [Atopobiaceae bacterium]
MTIQTKADASAQRKGKTMSKKHTLAKAAITAGLTLAMSLGGALAPATVAFAATNDGSVTISKRADNDNTTLQGYQIFKADVADVNSSKVASNLEWASDQVKTDVQTATGKTFATAQDAADYLATLSTSGTDYILANGDVLNTIANTLRNDTSLTPTTVTPGTASTGMSTGYWLFVTSKDSTNNTTDASKVDQTGTSPIYAIVGGSALTINQKATIPTVDKFVKNDKSDSDWGKVADSEVEQELNYKLVGTVAGNVATYDTYYYKFTDTLSAGLTADLSSVVVKVKNGDTETTVNASSYKKNIDSATNTLTVEFTDLKKAKDETGAAVTINKDSVVNVYYNAKLDASKAYKVASEDNPNEVKLTYSNNPNTDSKGDTTPHHVTDYTYKLAITKEDSTDATKKLQGAKFTIQATGADEGASTKYVQENGSLGDNPYEFTTDKNGEISVKGLDAGTYTVSETTAPTGYNKVADFTFTITPTWNDDATALKEVTVSDNSESVDSSFSTTNKQVELTVKDKAGHGLPLTGQAGVTFTWIAGGAVLAIGMAHLLRNRKQDDAE